MEISEKFKNKAESLKESLNPSKWLEGLMGKSGANSTMSSGSSSVQNDSMNVGRGKRNTKKDPKRTTIGAGQVSKLKAGDSSADILAKMFNFMEKNHELEVRRYEIEKAFRQEQLDEDEKRHKKLVEELTKKTGQTTQEEPKKEEPKKEESWIDKMLKGLKTALGIILKPFKFILNSIKFVLSAVIKSFELLFRLMKDITLLISKTVLTAVSSLATFLIGSIVSVLTPTIEFLTKSLIKATLKGVFSKLPKPIGTALSAALGLFFTNEALNEEKKLLQNLMPSDVIAEMKEGSGSDYDKAREKYNKSIQSGLGKEGAKKDFDNEALKLQKRVDEHIKENIEPIAKSAGYNINYEERDEIHSGAGLTGGINLPTVYSKGRFGEPDQVSTGAETLALMAAGLNKIDGGLDILKGKTEKLEKRIESSLGGVKGQFVEKYESGKNTILNELNNVNIPFLQNIEDTAGEYIDKGKNAATTILNKVNNIGGQKDQIKQLESAKARDNDSTFRKVIRNSVVAV